MAHRFTQALRTSAHPPRGTADTVARLSGDEFVVLLDSISAVEHVLEAAEWMKDAISQNVAIDQIELVLEESIRQVAEGIESYDQMMHLKEFGLRLWAGLLLRQTATGRRELPIGTGDQRVSTRVYSARDQIEPVDVRFPQFLKGQVVIGFAGRFYPAVKLDLD
jgi:hypothetical protein